MARSIPLTITMKHIGFTFASNCFWNSIWTAVQGCDRVENNEEKPLLFYFDHCVSLVFACCVATEFGLCLVLIWLFHWFLAFRTQFPSHSFDSFWIRFAFPFRALTPPPFPLSSANSSLLGQYRFLYVYYFSITTSIHFSFNINLFARIDLILLSVIFLLGYI